MKPWVFAEIEKYLSNRFRTDVNLELLEDSIEGVPLVCLELCNHAHEPIVRGIVRVDPQVTAFGAVIQELERVLAQGLEEYALGH